MFFRTPRLMYFLLPHAVARTIPPGLRCLLPTEHICVRIFGFRSFSIICELTAFFSGLAELPLLFTSYDYIILNGLSEAAVDKL